MMAGARSVPRLGLLAAVLVLGYLFLYAPIVSLIVYSFNASRLVTVWAGFSTRWYGELLDNDAIRGAASLSLEIAALSASLALILGTTAGFALAQQRRFAGRTLFVFMATAPLVMPEVITGLSLLLLFVALEDWIGWPAGRGIETIVLAHATFGMAFVAVIVQARLAAFDRSLEEAALGRGPGRCCSPSPCRDRAVAGHRLAARLHLVARRSRHRQLRLRPGLDDAADDHLLQCPAGRQPADQCPGDDLRPRRVVPMLVACWLTLRRSKEGGLVA
jgi:hypothetical protein